MDNNTETKVVKYLGQVYEVPLWANYIAADSDGDIYVYEKEPIWDEVEWYSEDGKLQAIHKSIGTKLPCLAI